MSDSEGLFRQVAALLRAKFAYLRARLQLAGIEGKEAFVHYAVIAALAVLALVVIIFGYFFLVIGAVFLVALAFDHEHAWIWITLAAAFLHFLAAALLLLLARVRLSQPMFTATLEEFRKDQQWLTTPAKPN